MILQVIKGTMMPFVLPMGVVLRMFPPTRDAGAFFISAAIAFQVVFPFTYVMHKEIVQGVLIKAAYSSTVNYDSVMAAQADSKYLVEYIGDHGIFNIQGMFWYPLIGVSFLLLQAIFLPALSMILTVAFIKGFNKFITQKFG